MTAFWRNSLCVVIVLVASSVFFLNGVQGEKLFLVSSGFESHSSLQKSPTGWHKRKFQKQKIMLNSFGTMRQSTKNKCLFRSRYPKIIQRM